MRAHWPFCPRTDNEALWPSRARGRRHGFTVIRGAMTQVYLSLISTPAHLLQLELVNCSGYIADPAR